MTDVQQSLLADCCAFFFVSSGKSIIFADGVLNIMRNEKLQMKNYKLEMRMINDKFPLSIGEEMVRNERTLLSKVEDGKMMMSADSTS